MIESIEVAGGRKSTATKRLILVELNEINFDIAVQYVEQFGLRHLQRLLRESTRITTTSEREYQHVEPWIQWVSAHTGLDYSAHGVFRLGDIVGSRFPQIFELVEQAGYTVGCISAMNVENRLKNPAFFIPDPWTQTPSDGSWWSRALTQAIAQAVNDNAQARVTPKSVVIILLSLLRFAQIKNYLLYFKLALGSHGRPWRKALFLDLMLHDVHMRLFRVRRPGFSAVFFNAGAHIQHHYFFNARLLNHKTKRNPDWYVSESDDPVHEMLEVYDRMLGDYLEESGASLIVATGLTQRPYDRVKYYYRLKNHVPFLHLLGLAFKAVHPRMTRDFVIEFKSPSDVLAAERKLRSIVASEDGQPIFGEIDNRGDGLFVTLTYPDEIAEDFMADYDGGRINLGRAVAFVAIKNGMHDSNGHAFFRGAVEKYAPKDGEHIKELFGTIRRYFTERC